MNTRWPSLYKRFIDDSIAIFKGLRAELDSFLSALQAMHPKPPLDLCCVSEGYRFPRPYHLVRP